MRNGEKFYSKSLKRVVMPGESIYMEELKNHILEKISFYRNAGCGAAGCNTEELILRNELQQINIFLNSQDQG